MPTTPDELVPTTGPADGPAGTVQQPPVEPAEIAPPGSIAQTYWFVLVGCVLVLGLVGCYCAVLYGHWHPISFSPHYPTT